MTGRVVEPTAFDDDDWQALLAQEPPAGREPLPTADAGTIEDAFLRAVEREAHALRVREQAARIVRQERAGALDEPSLVSLTDLLAVDDEPALYRVADVWPVGGRVVLAAQYKAGKTTLRNNLVRSLADGEPFLDHFDVEPFDGRVVVIDNELDERMLRRWLREQGIHNTDRVHVLALRGKVATFDLLDAACRARWAEKLRQIDAAVVLFDCLRPVLDALRLSEDKDAGRFLVAFDALLAEAGTPEGVVVHHMGHSGERSRGDTRIRDWPDVEWTLVRDRAEDGEQDASGARYFRAYGRDVDVPESLVEYDATTRRQKITGGSRRDAAGDKAVPPLLDYLREHPGASGRAIEGALVAADRKRADVRAAVRKACAAGLVRTAEGERRAVLHFLSDPDCASAPSAPSVRQRTGVECASAPIGRTHTHSQPEGGSAPGALARRTEPGTDAAPAEIGPCITCGNRTRRYGPQGDPRCPDCRRAPDELTGTPA